MSGLLLTGGVLCLVIAAVLLVVAFSDKEEE